MWGRVNVRVPPGPPNVIATVGHSLARCADLTSAPPPLGASEFVDLDAGRLERAGARHLVVIVFSYNDITFDLLPDAFAGFMLLGATSSEHHDPRGRPPLRPARRRRDSGAAIVDLAPASRSGSSSTASSISPHETDAPSPTSRYGPRRCAPTSISRGQRSHALRRDRPSPPQVAHLAAADLAITQRGPRRG